MGTGSWAALVVLKDVEVAGIRRENPRSVLVGVTLINHILSAGCVGIKAFGSGPYKPGV